MAQYGNLGALGAYLSMEDRKRAQDAQGLQQVMGLGSLVQQMRSQQMQEQRLTQEDARRQAAEMLAKQAYEQHLAPGRTVQNTEMLPDDNITGETARPQTYTRDAPVDFRAAGAMLLQNPLTAQQGLGLVNTQEQIEGRKQQAMLAAQTRLQELESRQRNEQLTREQRAELAKQANDLKIGLAQFAQEGRIDALRVAASLRPEPAPSPVTVMRDGKPVVIDARTGSIIGDAPPSKTLDAGKFTRIQQIVRDVENAPEMRLFKEIKPVVEAANNYASALKAGKRPISPEEDAGLARTYLRLAFPSRTVSTNKDAQLLLKQVGLPDRALNFLPSVLGGTRLTDEHRAQLLRAINDRANVVFRNVIEREDRAAEYFERSGLDPTIVPDVSGRRGKAKRDHPQQIQPATPATRSVDDLLRQYSGSQ